MITALVVGFAYELLWIAWTRAALGENALKAAVLTMVLGAFGLLGLTEALKGAGNAACLILGYGLGSFVAVRWGGSVKCASARCGQRATYVARWENVLTLLCYFCSWTKAGRAIRRRVKR